MAIKIQNASLAHVCGIPEQFPATDRPQVCFSGRSNVGKSSLINTILGRKSLARVSGEPGKTITVNFYDIDKQLFLVDLPGYGFAKRTPQERERLLLLGDTYFRAYAPDLCVQLIDMKVGATADDINMINWLNATKTPYVIAATKCDKLNKTQRAAAYAKIPVEPESIIPFSSLTGEGKDELWKTIFDAIK
ncbi:MAG: ribosome biogenesis GTP-binding protein YsxC [Clostridia bacterium]|jgi:GTP-binding protein|nr:ribosome biogenesis GTP-binding protein YsxC [Clostridia bacterium]